MPLRADFHPIESRTTEHRHQHVAIFTQCAPSVAVTFPHTSFPTMARLCERPGCSQPAEVIYGIDADGLTVWIEPFDETAGYRAGVLCRRHADAMVVPLGWMLDDRREMVPRLFKPREVAQPTKVKSKRKKQPAVSDETGQLELGVVPDEADDTGATERPAPEVAMGQRSGATPWKPIFDQNDDLDGLLSTDSPLLSRAFGRRERPEPR